VSESEAAEREKSLAAQQCATSTAWSRKQGGRSFARSVGREAVGVAPSVVSVSAWTRHPRLQNTASSR
jgi:hypothetical protein